MTTDCLPARPPLKAGSPVARAIHQLMAGERVVRLDTGEGIQAVQPVLDLLRWLWPLRPARAVGLSAASRRTSTVVAARARALIDEQWDGWGVVVSGPDSTLVAGRHRRGVAGPLYLDVRHDTLASGGNGDPHALVVTGFDKIAAVARQDVAQLPPAVLAADSRTRRPQQLLVVGPELPWHRRLQWVLDTALADDRRFHEPWGPIPIEVLLAGA